MWQSILADAAIVVGVLFFVLRQLEILLSNPQKQRLSDKLLWLWFWLAEAKKQSLLNWVRKRSRAVVTISVLLASLYAAWAFRNAAISSPGASTIIPALLIVAFAFWLGLKIVRRTLDSPSLLSAFLRASLFVLIAIMPLTIFLLMVMVFKDTVLSLVSSFAQSVAERQATLGSLGLALFALFFLWAFIFSVHFTVLALIFWSTVAVPLLLIYAVGALLAIIELIVRRTIEYPKGPILAVSGLLFAVGALLKFLS
jgi:hypothetical protein